MGEMNIEKIILQVFLLNNYATSMGGIYFFALYLYNPHDVNGTWQAVRASQQSILNHMEHAVPFIDKGRLFFKKNLKQITSSRYKILKIKKHN
ncbi:hypothetical protein ACJX0J_012428 [Zea mays]